MQLKFIKNKATRELALQIIYSLKICKNKNFKSKIKEFKLIKKNILKNINIKYLNNILKEVLKNNKYFNNVINKYINNYRYVNIIIKIILKIAIYEIKKNKKLPTKVIINESIELTKKFGSKNEYKFINKILHNICFKKKNINLK